VGMQDSVRQNHIIDEADLLSVVDSVDENSLLKAIKEQNTIRANDLVVHIDYGLGKFIGLETVRRNDRENDFLKIEYRDNSLLLIPAENCDLITKYSEFNEEIQLDRLGGNNVGSWAEKKAKIRQKILEYAGELIKIATKRQMQQATIFSVGDEELEEFCNYCGFKATIDQEKAVKDIVKNLSSGKVMDRLLCGDVGFGKTEVALRASFIVANSKNKGQVMIVAPTTLLCRQHYKTFTERFSCTDLKIGSLSRFNTAKENTKIKKQLENGEIDIIIGTHALFNKNIKFKNLGLAVVDEEQAFGVKQKERLKELKTNCHILSMSATPIPRTLQMSMSGIRDFSIIATPPLNRINVETTVIKYDDELIKQAINYEINRNGRVFFVVPRITDIKEVETRLDLSMPEVKYCSLHGQMDKNYIDEVMNDFYDGKHKVLISTTIIESGLDISLANTLIVYRANNFGLAQLYQLRGRVGRGNVQAFAYLTTKKTEEISETSEKRLKIIGDIKTLNSGFTIASEDMNIRGVGNVLGEAQSGHVKEVGTELYNQMFRDAVKEYKTNNTDKTAPATFSPEVKLGLSTTIPNDYIDNINIKMKYYRRIADIESLEERDRIWNELTKEYGTLPANAVNLLKISEIRILCKKLNVQRLEKRGDELIFSFFQNKCDEVNTLLDLVARYPNKFVFKHDKFICRLFGINEENVFESVKELLERLLSFK
jgi:transcription-repair coupling factor (superfamily II helicase)